jgi:hypothetical protein
MTIERLEATPTRRTTVEALPSELRRAIELPQCVAFGEANYTVETAVIQTFQLGSETDGALYFGGAERKIGTKWSAAGGVGRVQQATENHYRTDIQLRLKEIPAGRKVFLATSVNRAVTFSVQPDDALSVIFAASFKPEDSPGSPSLPWNPILIRNSATNQYVAFGRIPEIHPAPIMAFTSIGIAVPVAVACVVMLFANDTTVSIVTCAMSVLAIAIVVRMRVAAKRKWEEDLRKVQSLAEQCPLLPD